MGNLTEAIKNKGLQKMEIADSLGISRPTLDRYIENFELGAYEKVPDAVLEFFKAVITEDIDGSQAMESAKALTSEINKIKMEIDELQKHLEVISTEVAFLSNQLDDEKRTNEEKDLLLERQKDLIIRNKTLLDRREHLLKEYTELQHKLRKVTRLQTRDTTLAGPSWIKGDVDTLWTSFQGRLMILFKSEPGARTYVDIFTKIDAEEVLVGRFRPGEEMNYVTIDNLLPKLSYTYRVTVLTDEGKRTSGTIEIRNR